MKKIYLASLVIAIGSASLASFAWKTNSTSHASNNDQFYTLALSNETNQVRINGRLTAAQSTLIIAPEDVEITEIIAPFGSVVQEKDPLILIKSDDLRKKYFDQLIEYLTKKNDTQEALQELQSQQKLFDGGLTPKNEFNKAQKDYYLKEIDTIKSQRNLQKYVKAYESDWDEIESLKLADIEQFKTFMDSQNSIITLKASNTGTFAAYKKKDKVTQETTIIQPGAFIEKNQIIGSISDLNQLKVVANVTEQDVHHLQVGMQIDMALSYDRSINFTGTIETIDLSSQLDSNETISTYPVTIKPNTDKLSAKYLGKKVIINLETQQQSYLLAPISAVLIEKNRHAVLVGPERKLTNIEIGPTFGKFVAVLSGLKENQTVVLNPTSSDIELFNQSLPSSRSTSTLISL